MTSARSDISRRRVLLAFDHGAPATQPLAMARMLVETLGGELCRTVHRRHQPAAPGCTAVHARNRRDLGAVAAHRTAGREARPARAGRGGEAAAGGARSGALGSLVLPCRARRGAPARAGADDGVGCSRARSACAVVQARAGHGRSGRPATLLDATPARSVGPLFHGDSDRGHRPAPGRGAAMRRLLWL